MIQVLAYTMLLGMENYVKLVMLFHMPGIQYENRKQIHFECLFPSTAIKATALMGGFNKIIPLNYVLQLCPSAKFSHHTLLITDF